MRLTVWLSGFRPARAQCEVRRSPARLARDAVAVSGSVVEARQHDVGAVDLVAGGAEVLANRPDVSATAVVAARPRAADWRVLPWAVCRYLSCACVWLVSPRPPGLAVPAGHRA
jgi:hypothetical protein